MRGRSVSAWVGVVAVAAILIGVNWLVDSRAGTLQLDLTQGGLYTLSTGTRTVLRGLREPVTLRLFYSPTLGQRLPVYAAYADRVRRMLERYAAISHGKVRVAFLDPEPYSGVEDQAVALGLQGVSADREGEQVYFGIAGNNMLDDERQIAFLDPARERFLEYDLTRLVDELSHPTRPVVGVMSPLPLDGDPRAMMAAGGRDAAGRPFLAMLQLRQSFDVHLIKTDATVIDPDVQVLLVALPQHLSQATLYAIDQFVMRGGRLMAMVDPVDEFVAGRAPPDGTPQDTAGDLRPLLDAWGIAYDPGQVVGDLTGAWRVRTNADARLQAVSYAAWFNIRSGIAKGDPATADLQQVTVAAAGALAKKPGADIEFTPLLSSDTQSALIPADAVRTDPDPARILAEFHPTGRPYVIAARVRGVLHSAFKGPPPAPPGAPALPPYRATTTGPANLVVVADADILDDQFWVDVRDFAGRPQATPFSDNGAFVSNVVGTLAGGDVLLSLRGRGIGVRPFTRIDAMQARAEARFRATERTLQAHLDAVQRTLTTLRSDADGGRQAIITPDQRQAIDTARADILETRRRLRTVQLDLRRDIAGLEGGIRIADIAAVPAVVALAAIVVGGVRRRRRRRAWRGNGTADATGRPAA